MNGYYNQYDVRDAWWENKTGPLTTFVGNQNRSIGPITGLPRR